MDRRQIVWASTATIAITYGLARYAYGLFLPVIRRDLELTSTTLGLIASAAYIAYLLAILGSMFLATKTQLRLLVVLGGISATLGMLIVAFAQNSWSLAIGIFIAGTSPGWVYTVMPDIVAASHPRSTRDRSLVWINSGTSFGVILSGPIALWAGEKWRLAWLIFTVVALAVTAWNAKILPKGNSKTELSLPRLRWSWFVCPKSGPLFAFALGLGFTSSVYWTFAFDFIVTATEWQGSATLFWIVVGISGVMGTLAGRQLAGCRLSLRFNWTVVGYSLSIALLPIASTRLGILASGMLFGASYILLTGLLAIWSLRIFYQFPTAGQGANLLLLCIGQLIGPLVVGLLIAEVGFKLVFLGTAIGALVTIVCQPLEVD